MRTFASLFSITLLCATSVFISACSSPIVYDVRYDNISFDKANRTTMVTDLDGRTETKIKNLHKEILGLGPNIDTHEAYFVAREAVLYARHLANEYRLIGPPNSHNILVNTGKRDRGLCYHFARDMTAHIVKGRTFNTLTLKRAVAFQGKHVEHNVLTVAAKGKGVEDAIILDAWRKSGDLYAIKTGEDPLYPWEKYTPRTYTPATTVKQ